MSSHPSSSAPSGKNWNPLTEVHKLIKPRNVKDARSVITNIGDSTQKVWEAMKSVVATVADAPLAILEVGVALPNNIVGTITTGIDRAIVGPTSKVRNAIREVLTKPGDLFKETKKAPAGGGHH